MAGLISHTANSFKCKEKKYILSKVEVEGEGGAQW